MKHSKGEASTYPTGDVSTSVYLDQPPPKDDIYLCEVYTSKEDAALIAEAFNVTNQTGKTPGELRDENETLRAELVNCKITLEQSRKSVGGGLREFFDTQIEQIDKSLEQTK